MLDYGRRLVQLAPVLYIPGNHERRLADFDTLMHELSAIGFHVLTDKIETVKGITFLGLDENQPALRPIASAKQALFTTGTPLPCLPGWQSTRAIRSCCAHYPENFAAVAENNYRQYDFDLQLSGHAHGGQWILPGIGPVFSPGQGLRPQYARGSFEERPRLIVSRGIGNAEFPLRLFNHPEIIVLHLNPTK